MSSYVLVVQIVLSIALIVLVLVQTRGEGMNASFTADNSIFRTRRGVEKTLFQLTIGAGVLFILVSILSVLLARA
ncbi:MAG: preprotein translocase subunit SecG [Chloroflexota bacterium]